MALVLLPRPSLGDDAPFVDKKADEVLELLDQMPDWPLTPLVEDKKLLEKATADARKIEELAAAIDRYEGRYIRLALVRYLTKNRRSTRSVRTCFILTLYLFQTPADAERDSKDRQELVKNRPAPLSRKPLDSLLWPWEETKAGLKFNTDAWGLVSSGSDRDPIEVYDYASERFGRRVEGAKNEAANEPKK